MKTIGIRREDKNAWERRVPLVPADVADLLRDNDLAVVVQPSPIRVHADAEYAAAGAVVAEDLSPADVVFGVKEMPLHELRDGRTYLYFAHVIKGQPYNMPMLSRLRCPKIRIWSNGFVPVLLARSLARKWTNWSTAGLMEIPLGGSKNA